MRQSLRFPFVIGLAAVFVTGCGEGRAIFNIDAYSFLAGEIDTVHYAAPPIAGSFDTTTAPLEISLLAGLGNSSVDTVYITAAANLLNTTGNATVRLEIFFADSQATVYSRPPQVVTSGSVNGAQTVPIGTTVIVSDSLFSQPTLWVGIRVGITNNAPALVDGRMALSGLDLRIVLNDQVF